MSPDLEPPASPMITPPERVGRRSRFLLNGLLILGTQLGPNTNGGKWPPRGAPK